MNRNPMSSYNTREKRKERHNKRVTQEMKQMTENGQSIKIDHWLPEDKEADWLIIRVGFSDPIIPVKYKTDIRAILYDLFDGHIQRPEVSK